MVRTRLLFLIPALLGVAAAQSPLRPITAGTESPAIFPAEVIAITRFGVSPASIVRKEGPFVLLIQKGLEDRTEDYVLTREGDTAQLMKITTTRTMHRAHMAINPAPGKYRLRRPKYPDSDFQITILPE